jgi:hypothetical protein
MRTACQSRVPAGQSVNHHLVKWCATPEYALGKVNLADSGILAPGRRSLTIGLVLVLVVVAFEGLAVVTIMPITVRALRGLAVYAWSFSDFMLGSLDATSWTQGGAKDKASVLLRGREM